MIHNMRSNTLVINILGNSQAMAVLKEKQYYKDTYAFKIVSSLNFETVVINKARRNMTVTEQATDINIQDDIVSINADYHIIQFGIVDCAPRLFTQRERRYLRRIPGNKLIINFMSKNRYFFTKHFPKVYVKKDKFNKRYLYLLETIINSTNTKKIFIINIAATRERNERRSFGVGKNINEYNVIIEQLSKKFPDKVCLINLYEMTKAELSLVSEDGIHITKEAHQLLANVICSQIVDIEKIN